LPQFLYNNEQEIRRIFMTLEQVARELSLNESTIKGHFKRTQDTLKKKGILLTKEGRGDKAVYSIDYTHKKD
jgi:transcriptional antiterminator